MDIKFIYLLLNKLILFDLICCAMMQQTHVYLRQGTLAGLKVFPDSARSAVYAFLGVPYAEPPLKELRFAPPKAHNGWNRTLLATSMRPVCPQLSNTIYDETSGGYLGRPIDTNEDCLYLNIWVSENGLRYGKLPVLVVLTGEDMSYDWSRNRITGLDIAADGIVVITVQYRTNIFGWLNVEGNNDLNGNYGILDQLLALKWIHQNIESLGGNRNQITLLGHGTSGAPCAFYHSLFNKDLISSSSYFNQLILMSSGNIDRGLHPTTFVQEASIVIIKKLGCQFEEYDKQLLICLRSKSVSDLLKAFESLYDHGNGTLHLGPSLPHNYKDILTDVSITKLFPTSMIGITSNEGAFMQDYWLQLATDGYYSLKSYIEHTLLRNVLLPKGQLNGNSRKHSLDALNWRYFGPHLAENPIQLLSSLQRFISEYNYEIPFYQLLNIISNVTETGLNSKLYAYINDFSNAMDIRGKINLFGGASHTSDLPFLFGPTLFQQIARRRLTNEEEVIYQKIKPAFLNFIRNGNPQSGENDLDWIPYSNKNKFIYELGKSWSSSKYDSMFLEPKKLNKITQFLFNGKSTPISNPHRNEFSNSYQILNINNDLPITAKVGTASAYAAHLIKVYGFWEIFLPDVITKNYDSYISNTEITQHLLYIEASADAARFKNGFFLMLGLVLLLLSLLCLCVYLLRHNSLTSMPQISCDL